MHTRFEFVIKRRKNIPVPTAEQLLKCKERTKEDVAVMLVDHADQQVTRRSRSKSLVPYRKMLFERRMRRLLSLDMQDKSHREVIKHMEKFWLPDGNLPKAPRCLADQGFTNLEWLRLAQYYQCAWRRHRSNNCRHSHPLLLKAPPADVIPDAKLASTSWTAPVHGLVDAEYGLTAPRGTSATAMTLKLPERCACTPQSRSMQDYQSGAAEILARSRNDFIDKFMLFQSKRIPLPGGDGRMRRYISRFRWRSTADNAVDQSNLRYVKSADNDDDDSGLQDTEQKLPIHIRPWLSHDEVWVKVEHDTQLDEAWERYWETEGLEEVLQHYNDIPEDQWLKDGEASESDDADDNESETSSEDPISPETPVDGKENEYGHWHKKLRVS